MNISVSKPSIRISKIIPHLLTGFPQGNKPVIFNISKELINNSNI